MTKASLNRAAIDAKPEAPSIHIMKTVVIEVFKYFNYVTLSFDIVSFLLNTDNIKRVVFPGAGSHRVRPEKSSAEGDSQVSE